MKEGNYRSNMGKGTKRCFKNGVLGGFIAYEGAYGKSLKNHQALAKISYQF